MLLARILKQFLGVLLADLGGWLAGILFAFAWAAVDVTTSRRGASNSTLRATVDRRSRVGCLYLSRSAGLAPAVFLRPAFFAVMALAHRHKFGRTGWRVHCFRIPFAA